MFKTIFVSARGKRSEKQNASATTRIVTFAALALFAFAATADAQPWTSYADNTRYLAIGDSLSAGYEAKPATQGFVYQLYQGGAVDSLNNLLFCNMSVPGARSIDVLSHQVPQAQLFFEETGKSYKKVVTITVGGNDALALLDPSGNINLGQVPGMIQAYGNNLATIFGALIAANLDVHIYVGNLYDPKLPIPGADLLIAAMNQATATVAGFFPANVTLVDIHTAFDGRSGLLLVERKGAGFNIHPTDAGYRVMTNTFADAIASHP